MRISEFIEGKIKEAGAKQGLRLLEAIKKNPSIAMEHKIILPGAPRGSGFFPTKENIELAESKLQEGKKGIDPELIKAAKGKKFFDEEAINLEDARNKQINLKSFRVDGKFNNFENTRYNTDLMTVQRGFSKFKKKYLRANENLKKVESKYFNHKTQELNLIQPAINDTIEIYDLGRSQPKDKVHPSTIHLAKNPWELNDLIPDRDKAWLPQIKNSIQKSELTQQGRNAEIDSNSQYEKVVKSEYLKDKKIGEIIQAAKPIPEPRLRRNIAREIEYSDDLPSIKNKIEIDEMTTYNTSNNYKDRLFNVNYANANKHIVPYYKGVSNEVNNFMDRKTNLKKLPLEKDVYGDYKYKGVLDIKENNIYTYPSAYIDKDKAIENLGNNRYWFKGTKGVSGLSEADYQEIKNKEDVNLWGSNLPIVAKRYAGDNMNFNHPVYIKAINQQAMDKALKPYKKEASLAEQLHYIDNSFLGTRLQDINSYGKMITSIKNHPLKATAGGAYLGLSGYGLAKSIDQKDEHKYSGLDAFNAMAGVTPYFAWRGITN